MILLLIEREKHGTNLPTKRSSSARVEKRETLRWRPRSRRIRRNRQVIDQTGLKVFLLPPQAAASFEGAQVLAERPSRRPRTGQPHASRVRPRAAKWSNETNHILIMPENIWKSIIDSRKSRGKTMRREPYSGTRRKGDRHSATDRVYQAQQVVFNGRLN